MTKEETKEVKIPKKEKLSKEAEELVVLKNHNQELIDKNLRLMAEIQNLQRRYSEELNRLAKRDGEKFIKEFLPVIDNFERALCVDEESLNTDTLNFLTGFKMTYANMIQSLNALGVKEIECINKEFDPNTMEAVLTDHIDDFPVNTVTDVLQKGYMYNDVLIRPAMVKVNN